MGKSMSVPSSTSVISIIDRLQRSDRPDLIAAIRSGRISAYGVAVAMGWKKRPATLGTGPPNRARRRDAILQELGLPTNGKAREPEAERELTLRDACEIQELIFGVDRVGSMFASIQDLRKAWRKHRAVALKIAAPSKPLALEFLERERRKKKPRVAKTAGPGAYVAGNGVQHNATRVDSSTAEGAPNAAIAPPRRC
jgi:hypothetical protein